MILPFQTLRYTTKMRPDEVVSVLRANVGEPPKWFKQPPQDYLGTVGEQSFRIFRKLPSFRYNSFLPQLRGKITGLPIGSEVKVRFEIHRGILAFFVVWELFALSFPAPESFGFAAFGIVLFAGAFFPEATKAEQDIKRMIPPAPEYSITEVPQLR